MKDNLCVSLTKPLSAQIFFSFSNIYFGQINWLNIILNISVKEFLDEINIWVVRLSKANGPSSCGSAPSNPLKTWIEQKSLSNIGSLHQVLPDCLQVRILVFYLWTLIHTWTYIVGCHDSLDQDQNYNINSGLLTAYLGNSQLS